MHLTIFEPLVLSLLHPLTRVYRATKEWEVSRKFALSHVSV